MDEIDIEIRPDSKIPRELNENQTVKNEEADEEEDYDDEDEYSCYK